MRTTTSGALDESFTDQWQGVRPHQARFRTCRPQAFRNHANLKRYRKNGLIEKVFQSLKNEIKVKPVGCWKKERQICVLLVRFLVHTIIAPLGYKVPKTTHTCTKFIKKSPQILTGTVMHQKNCQIAHAYPNFDTINMAILRICEVVYENQGR